MWTGRPFTGAHEAAPIAEERLGLLVYGHDHWWTVRSKAEASAVATEISAALEGHSPAFYSKFAGSEAALATFDAGGAIPIPFHRELIHATLLQSHGRREESAALVAQALAEHPNWLAGREAAARLDLERGGCS